MHVTPEQRDRAESWLKEAYADGRITESEFDTPDRPGARRRHPQGPERGVLRPGPGAHALPRARACTRRTSRWSDRRREQQAGRGVAGVRALLGASSSGCFGPALVFALSARRARTPGGRRPRRSTSSSIASIALRCWSGSSARHHRPRHLRRADRLPFMGWLGGAHHRRRRQGPAG